MQVSPTVSPPSLLHEHVQLLRSLRVTHSFRDTVELVDVMHFENKALDKGHIGAMGKDIFDLLKIALLPDLLTNDESVDIKNCCKTELPPQYAQPVPYLILMFVSDASLLVVDRLALDWKPPGPPHLLGTICSMAGVSCRCPPTLSVARM